MANLYLHVGHSKTGTTWIQAAAALSHQALHANGIHYPTFGVERSPDSTAIELGNASTAALSLPRFAETLDAIGPLDGLRGALLSSEELFVQLNALADPEAVAAAARAAGFDAIHVLLFIRNPMEHAASLWQQYLKRGGGSARIEPFFEKYAVPARVAEFLETYGAHEQIAVTVYNYSRHRAGVLAPVSRWLGVDPDIWTTARAGTLNRTQAERDHCQRIILIVCVVAKQVAGSVGTTGGVRHTATFVSRASIVESHRWQVYLDAGCGRHIDQGQRREIILGQVPNGSAIEFQGGTKGDPIIVCIGQDQGVGEGQGGCSRTRHVAQITRGTANHQTNAGSTCDIDFLTEMNGEG